MTQPRLIVIDWGTSAARAYWLDEDGQVMHERANSLGIQKIADGDFAAALESLLGEPPPDDVPLLACGMIGSRQGWVEAPYRDCPADFAELSGALTPVTGTRMLIVPGLICRDGRGIPDVMRGEETKIAGAFSEAFKGERIVLTPGTHCKWTVVSAARIERFASFMTGELYAVLREHSILGRMASDASSLAAFEQGVAASLRDGAMLTHDLFSARTLALTGELAADEVGDYLSGLLIGAEIASGRRWLSKHGERSEHFDPAQPVLLLGEPALTERYEVALAMAGIASTVGPHDAVVRGLWRIAQAICGAQAIPSAQAIHGAQAIPGS